MSAAAAVPGGRQDAGGGGMLGRFRSRVMATRVLSGIQPTGPMHWGNYFGAVRQYIELQDHGRRDGGQALYFIADLHALTTVRDADQLRAYTRELAIDLLSLGLDPDAATLFVQSDVPEVAELTWLLLTVTPLSMLQKAHAFKDKTAKGLAADAGLFTYPVLQAADILAYDSTLVPVGEDQKQHIEMTRDLAQKFNNLYSADVFVIPEPHILDASSRVPGTDGEKMSKSYGNTLPVFGGAKAIRKSVMSITTDSLGVEDPKEPEGNTIFDLYRLFATAEEEQAMAERFRAGGMGYGDAKKALLETSQASFAAARERREKLAASPDVVTDILQHGAAAARTKAAEVLDRARAACGLSRRLATR